MKENPVRASATWVLRQSRFVSLNEDGLRKLAEALLELPDPEWVSAYHFRGEEELTLRYLLVLDALNFCFWPPSFFTLTPTLPHRGGGQQNENHPGGESAVRNRAGEEIVEKEGRRIENHGGPENPSGHGMPVIPGKNSPSPQGGEGGGEGEAGKWSVTGPSGERLTGYYALSFRLRQLAEDFPDFFSPSFLSRVQPEEVWEFLGPIPLPAWRAKALNEVGALLARFGSASQFFSQAKNSAQKLVELLTSHLPMFRDTALYRGKWVPFYKRAQILVADLWGTFGGKGFGEFPDLSWLTAFADYKLPQILWDRGAICLAPSLAGRIFARELIPRGSEEEVELRAATVVAVERLVGLLRERGREILPFQVDWLLWNLSQQGLSVPHHRTLTWAY